MTTLVFGVLLLVAAAALAFYLRTQRSRKATGVAWTEGVQAQPDTFRVVRFYKRSPSVVAYDGDRGAAARDAFRHVISLSDRATTRVEFWHGVILRDWWPRDVR